VEDTSNKKTEKPDTSSSDPNLTGIALHAQIATLDTQPPELDTRTQESILIESLTGDHHSTHGETSTEELPTEDTAKVTRRASTATELLKLVEPGLERLIQKPDSSSTENNPTGIALHAHSTTEEETQELLLTTQEFMFIES